MAGSSGGSDSLRIISPSRLIRKTAPRTVAEPKLNTATSKSTGICRVINDDAGANRVMARFATSSCDERTKLTREAGIKDSSMSRLIADTAGMSASPSKSSQPPRGKSEIR